MPEDDELQSITTSPSLLVSICQCVIRWQPHLTEDVIISKELWQALTSDIGAEFTPTSRHDNVATHFWKAFESYRKEREENDDTTSNNNFKPELEKLLETIYNERHAWIAQTLTDKAGNEDFATFGGLSSPDALSIARNVLYRRKLHEHKELSKSTIQVRSLRSASIFILQECLRQKPYLYAEWEDFNIKVRAELHRKETEPVKILTKLFKQYANAPAVTEDEDDEDEIAILVQKIENERRAVIAKYGPDFSIVMRLIREVYYVKPFFQQSRWNIIFRNIGISLSISNVSSTNVDQLFFKYYNQYRSECGNTKSSSLPTEMIQSFSKLYSVYYQELQEALVNAIERPPSAVVVVVNGKSPELSDEDDIAIIRKVLQVNPFDVTLTSLEMRAKWDEIVKALDGRSNPQCHSVVYRVKTLVRRYSEFLASGAEEHGLDNRRLFTIRYQVRWIMMRELHSAYLKLKSSDATTPCCGSATTNNEDDVVLVMDKPDSSDIMILQEAMQAKLHTRNSLKVKEVIRTTVHGRIAKKFPDLSLGYVNTRYMSLKKFIRQYKEGCGNVSKRRTMSALKFQLLEQHWDEHLLSIELEEDLQLEKEKAAQESLKTRTMTRTKAIVAAKERRHEQIQHIMEEVVTGKKRPALAPLDIVLVAREKRGPTKKDLLKEKAAVARELKRQKRESEERKVQDKKNQSSVCYLPALMIKKRDGGTYNHQQKRGDKVLSSSFVTNIEQKMRRALDEWDPEVDINEAFTVAVKQGLKSHIIATPSKRRKLPPVFSSTHLRERCAWAGGCEVQYHTIEEAMVHQISAHGAVLPQTPIYTRHIGNPQLMFECTKPIPPETIFASKQTTEFAFKPTLEAARDTNGAVAELWQGARAGPLFRSLHSSYVRLTHGTETLEAERQYLVAFKYYCRWLKYRPRELPINLAPTRGYTVNHQHLPPVNVVKLVGPGMNWLSSYDSFHKV